MRENLLTQERIEKAFRDGIKNTLALMILSNLCINKASHKSLYESFKDTVVCTIGDNNITLEDISSLKLEEIGWLASCETSEDILHIYLNEKLHGLLKFYDTKIGFKDSDLSTRYGKINMTPLNIATLVKDKELLRRFLKKEAGQSALAIGDAQGKTPLHYAALEGAIDNMNILLETSTGKQTLKKEDIFHRLPIHWAARMGKVESIERIFALPEQLDTLMQKDKFGQTPAHLAAREGHTETMRILISTDIGERALELRDGNTKTPLQLAYDKGHLEIMQIILANKIGQNTLEKADSKYNTILHQAVIARNSSAIEVVLGCNKGIELLNRSNSSDKTPWQLAHETKDRQVIGTIKGRIRWGDGPQYSLEEMPWRSKVKDMGLPKIEWRTKILEDQLASGAAYQSYG